MNIEMQPRSPDQTTSFDRDRLDTARLRRLDLRAMLAMLAAATTVAAQTDAELRRSGAGVKASEWDVLAMLHAYGPQRPVEIARRAALSINAPTVHAILGRLEGRGLIARESHPDHARAVLVTLSADGIDLVERLFPVLERKVIGRFAAHYSPEELDSMAELMERL